MRRPLALVATTVLAAALVPVGSTAAPAVDVTSVHPLSTTMDGDYCHAVFLDAGGRVWASGGPGYGSLGNGITSGPVTDDPEEMPLPAGVRATQVRTGGYNTTVIGDDGRLYGTGLNDHHQLTGTGDRTALTAFAWADGVTPQRIVSAESTTNSGVPGTTVAIGADGTVYFTGRHPTAPSDQDGLTPYPVVFPTGAGVGVPAQVVVGQSVALVITSTGRLYGHGNNHLNRLTSAADIGSWTRLDSSGGVVGAAAGWDHTTWLTQDGRIYGVGSDDHGQLGTSGAAANAAAPVQADGTGWVGLAASNVQSVLAIKSDGTVWLTGQLMDYSGDSANGTWQEVPGADHAAEVAGSGSYLMRDADGVVWTAGSNVCAQAASGHGTFLTQWYRQDDQPLVQTGVIGASGRIGVGLPLTATDAWLPVVSPTRSWKVDGVERGSGATYVPTTADAGHVISIEAGASGADLIPVAATGAVVGQVPACNSAAPVLSGKAKKGKRLETTLGTWAGVGYAYGIQWYRGAKPIAGATKAAYKVKAKDRGKRLSVRVTARRSGWPTVTAVSAARKVRR